jgi:hypothetical protein
MAESIDAITLRLPLNQFLVKFAAASGVFAAQSKLDKLIARGYANTKAS